jgi:hypothetical protein
MPKRLGAWADVMQDSWETQTAGLSIMPESSNGHKYWICSRCQYRARQETFCKRHAPVLCGLLAASRGFPDIAVDAELLFRQTALPVDGSWRQRQADLNTSESRGRHASSDEAQLMICPTPHPGSMDVRVDGCSAQQIDLTRTKRSGDQILAYEDSEQHQDKRTSIWNPVSEFHPVPRPGVLNGTGYEAADICRFVLGAENQIREPGRWAPLFVPIVEACRLWNRGGPFPSVSLRTNFKSNLMVLNNRVNHADTL